ncbi:DUF4136 domain-containing protein [bacterium]|nr:DUF4136 domain-containing protein [bacterium]
MLWLRNILCACFIFTFAGCAPISVTTNYDTSVNFSNLKTFDWMPNATISVNDPRIIDNVVESNIKNAVLKELTQKGYKKISSGKPDFYVAYTASLKEKTKEVTLTNYYGYPGYPATWTHWSGPSLTQTYCVNFDEGTVVIDFVDPTTKQPIWRSTAKAEVTLTDDPEIKQNRTNEAVNKMLYEFPPTEKK